MLRQPLRALSARHRLICNSTSRRTSTQAAQSHTPTQPTPPSQRTAQTAPPTLTAMYEAGLHLRGPPKEEPLPSGSNVGLYVTALVLLLGIPPGVYFWWQHRAEHMGQKKAALMREVEERRTAWDGGK